MLTDRARIGILVLAIGLLSTLHYLTDPSRVVWHGVYQRLYYVPVIVAAYWFGVRGGLVTALLTSLAYLPHIRVAWIDNPAHAVSQYIEIAVFHLLGAAVGLLVASQRRLVTRYRDAAASLEVANRELRESYEQLRRADRLSALGQVAAGLAHELRSPLASVGGALEIIASRVKPGNPEAEFCEIARKELKRLEGLVTEFLTYARPRDPELRPTRIGDLLEHVVRLLGPEAERRHVTIDFTRSADVPDVRVDPQQIEQVLLNVALNAVQAGRPGTPVRIRTSRENDHVAVDIIDQGPGIPREHLHHIFDPFFTTKDKGTGLGLAISHRIVIAHGGSIEARQAPGSGAWIRVRLPLDGPDGESARPSGANVTI